MWGDLYSCISGGSSLSPYSVLHSYTLHEISEAHIAAREESMCHHRVMPTLLLMLTDTMNLQPDSTIFILNSVMDWDFNHFSD